jgi:acetolactate synthase-1/2/3 large subunit
MIKELKNIHNISDDEITFSDYVITRLLDHGVSTVFGLTGGGIMYLIDSLARNSDCKLITVHHESFGGLAADAYSKVGNNIGVALGTTGPGVTNLFTSITAAWQDSSRVLFIGGQVKTADSSRINNLYVRQNGTFEFDAIDTYKHVTKYCEIIDDAEKGIIKLEEAITALNHNRPGPSYIEIPLDIQGKKIKIDKIKQIHSSFKSSYDAEITKKTEIKRNNNINIYTSNSPLFIIGAGVLKSNSSKKLRQFLLKHSLPYVVTPLAIGFSNSADKNYLGVLSIRGNRSANIVSQQASSIIVIGCSLHQQIVGWDPKIFNPDAKKTWFEIDKNITDLRSADLSIDNVYNIDIDEAYNAINKSNIFEENDYSEWLSYTSIIKHEHYKHYKESSGLDLYDLLDVLNNYMHKFSCIATDAGQPWYILPQSLNLLEDTQFISSGSYGSMGMTVPYMVGAGQINLKNSILGVIGDGSLMMCLQELSTLKTYLQRFILVIVNNNGYRSIRGTHDKFFNGRTIGTDKSNGVFIPSYKTISNSFGIDYRSVKTIDEFQNILDSYQNQQLIVELFTDNDQSIEPLVISKMDEAGNFVNTSIDDMYPYVEYKIFKK